MTVAELVEMAKAWRARTDIDDAHIVADVIAQAVIDLLAEAMPCGMDAPNVWLVDRKMDLPASWCESAIDSDEARSMARLLLAAADQADAKEPSHD